MSNLIMRKVGRTNWPFGRDGKLVIQNGETVTLNPGDEKDYASIDIQSGGLLKVDAGTGDWVVVGCRGNCVIDGTIEVKQGEHTGGTFNKTSPDGESLSHISTQQSGGAGGTSGNGASGGTSSYGNGGGGGASSSNTGYNDSSSKGGDGADSASGASGGVGASVYSSNGGNGIDGDNESGGDGGGGGGSSRGRHGQALYLKVMGNLSGSGSINASGSNAGNGGSGGAGTSGLGVTV